MKRYFWFLALLSFSTGLFAARNISDSRKETFRNSDSSGSAPTSQRAPSFRAPRNATDTPSPFPANALFPTATSGIPASTRTPIPHPYNALEKQALPVKAMAVPVGTVTTICIKSGDPGTSGVIFTTFAGQMFCGGAVISGDANGEVGIDVNGRHELFTATLNIPSDSTIQGGSIDFGADDIMSVSVNGNFVSSGSFCTVADIPINFLVSGQNNFSFDVSDNCCPASSFNTLDLAYSICVTVLSGQTQTPTTSPTNTPTVTPTPTCAPPQVAINNADVCGNAITITIQPTCQIGKFDLVLLGRAGPKTIVSPVSKSGGVTFGEKFHFDALPSGRNARFDSLRADWIITTANGPVTATASLGVTPFKNVGMYRHSQYNIPHESDATCQGSPMDVCLFDSTCTFTSVTMSDIFFSQVNLNGTGFSNNGLVRNAILGPPRCRNPRRVPNTCSSLMFLDQSGVFGIGCRNDSSQLSDTSVAVGRHNSDGLQCGDTICLIGAGANSAGVTKTITDSCPACTGNQQLDNFTTNGACSGIPDLGNFQTIQLNP